MNKHQVSPELWAIVDAEGNVLWTRGGSSTSPKLMVYPSEAKAMRGYGWVSMEGTRIERIYKVNTTIELWEADPDCEHEIVDGDNYSGVKCKKCKGWFCF